MSAPDDTMHAWQQELERLRSELDAKDLDIGWLRSCRERLSTENGKLRDQVAGLTRHRDGCVSQLEAIRAYAEEVAADFPAAVTPRRILSILDANPTPALDAKQRPE